MTFLTTKKWLCRNHRFSQRSWGRLPILKGAVGWRRFEKSSTFSRREGQTGEDVHQDIFEVTSATAAKSKIVY
jgi:hypothetical protein